MLFAKRGSASGGGSLEGASRARRKDGMAFDSASAADGFNLRGAAKLGFVSAMFDEIAASYDAVNHFISLGQTTLWRWLAFAWRRDIFTPGARVLDVGCGTGAVVGLLERVYDRARLRITGLDCSTAMLDIARSVHPRHRFCHGDVCALPFKQGEFDVVTSCYTIRSFPDMATGFADIMRVLRPGGTLVLLDAFPPPSSLMRKILALWLDLVMPLLARACGNGSAASDKAYAYLAASIQGTLAPDAVAAILKQAGAQEVSITRYTFGACCRLIAHRRRDE